MCVCACKYIYIFNFRTNHNSLGDESDAPILAKDEEKNASDNNLVNAAQNDTLNGMSPLSNALVKSTPNIEQSTKTSSLGVVANDLVDLKNRKSLPGDVNVSAAIKSIPPWNKAATTAINNALNNRDYFLKMSFIQQF